MILIFSLSIALAFTAGVRLVLSRDLFRIAVGTTLLPTATNVLLLAAAGTRGDAPILPPAGAEVSDPVVQALALTAIVINFGVTALLVVLVYRVYQGTGSLDLEAMVESERADERRREEEAP